MKRIDSQLVVIDGAIDHKNMSSVCVVGCHLLHWNWARLVIVLLLLGKDRSSGETAHHDDRGVELPAYTQLPHTALFAVRSHASPTTLCAN